MSQNLSLPFVSAMIVARNESAYIEKSLKSLINQNYPKERYEILFIDGNSDDDTVEIVKEIISDYEKGNYNLNIKILNNPKKILASGWNLGIHEAKGDYVVRIDAHSFVENDFISKCVEVMLRVGDAVCVGGCMNSDSIDKRGKAISNVLSSPFGVGNSKFRYSKTAEYVDTVAFGLYKRTIYDEVGYFDESLKRNQDIDLHSRIKAVGGKFYLDPSIVVTYYARNSVKSMIKQGYQNGKWNISVFKKNPRALSIRHVIPLFFVLGIIGCLFLGFFSNLFWYLMISVICLHLVLGVLFSIKKTNKLKQILEMPMLFLLLHLSYGIGSFSAIFSK